MSTEVDENPDTFLLSISSINLKTGVVKLEKQGDSEVPVTMTWNYGPGLTSIGDKIGDTYRVEMIRVLPYDDSR